MTIFVLDCGIGNVGAVRSMYRRLGHPAELIVEPRQLRSGDRLVLPGVGAFDAGVRAIEEGGWRPYLLEAAAAGFPILGICLGMQLMCRRSDEGVLGGLDLLPIEVRKLVPVRDKARVPHMGWNVVTPMRPQPLLVADEGEQRFYFTHSYAVAANDDHALAVTDHGGPFASMIGRGNLIGVQFHPEKSHRFGKALLERFAGWDPTP